MGRMTDFAPADRNESVEDDAVGPTGQFRRLHGSGRRRGKDLPCSTRWVGRRRGTDVVVGFVETQWATPYRRADSGPRSRPRKVVAYRGSQFEEMDVDAVLTVTPSWRWWTSSPTPMSPTRGAARSGRGIMELIDDGIAVITTVNVQHLESMPTPSSA